ncbi:MAG: hypothetical protein ACKO44_05600, partial [Algoriphagus sp.]
MSNIILQPTGNKDARKHYVDTIQHGIKLLDIKQHLTPKDYESLEHIYPSGECYIWGVTPGDKNRNVSKWNKMNIGDVTLFSRDGGVFSSGVTTYKLHSESLAVAIWDRDKEGNTWEYIYFIDEIKSLSISYKELHSIIGYTGDPDNWVILGFTVLDSDKSQNVFNALDLQSYTFTEDLTPEEFTNIVSRLVQLEKTETETTSKTRLEQSFLKKLLFKKKIVGTCACCKKELPIAYLWAAHIKKRSHCTVQERKDYNIVIPLCKLGCDELFEKGYIAVNDAGLFHSLKKKPTSADLETYILSIGDQPCTYYNA